MAELSYRTETGELLRRVDWRAVWGGTFIFYAIWAVFGALGLAIFASNANRSAAAPVTGQSVGMAIWAVVLTIIAMYVAGRETGRLANVGTRHDGLVHGLIMFGLATFGLVLLTSFGGSAITYGNATAAGSRSSTAITLANLGWAGFVALFLGWLAAMFGASAGVAQKADHPLERTEPRQIRPAA